MDMVPANDGGLVALMNVMLHDVAMTVSVSLEQKWVTIDTPEPGSAATGDGIKIETTHRKEKWDKRNGTKGGARKRLLVIETNMGNKDLKREEKNMNNEFCKG